MVREGASPLPVPPPRHEDGLTTSVVTQVKRNHGTPAGGAHAAGAASPRERLSNTQRMVGTETHQQEKTSSVAAGAEP
ncbi:MAG: hypothetical protein H6R30_124 [Methanomicrobia archaeon]|nr:hypothetical protein [Methanomicrobia archaeon]